MEILLLALALSAPVPKDRPPALPVAPGHYSLQWCTTPYAAEFDADGGFRERCRGGVQWVGLWQWDPATRTLSISETNTCGASWLHWQAVLDSDLKGRTNGGVPVQLKPVKE